MSRVVVWLTDSERDGARIGHVIDVLPDGQSLGREGDRHPEWTVLEVSPDLTSAEIAALRDRDVSIAPVSRVKYRVDVQGLQARADQPAKMSKAAFLARAVSE